MPIAPGLARLIDPPAFTALRRALLAVVDLAVPLTCGACGASGHRWCPGCRAEMATTDGVDDPVPTASALDRPPTWSTHSYEGAVACAIVAYKDGGRRDLLDGLDGQLARSLRAAVEAFGPRDEPILVVPVPASPASIRRRGDAPLDPLARSAVRAVEAELGPGRVVWAPVLRVRRRVGDQAHLSARGRAENVAGAFELCTRRSRSRSVSTVNGAVCVVVDDVTTTGASLAEAARALRQSGAVSVHAAVLAATRLRRADLRPALPP